MANKDIAFQLRHGMFAKRDSIEEALKDAYEMIEAIPAEGGSRMAAYTALHIVLNTIAAELENEEKTLWQCPDCECWNSLEKDIDRCPHCGERQHVEGCKQI